jgi:hypothetical protein
MKETEKQNPHCFPEAMGMRQQMMREVLELFGIAFFFFCKARHEFVLYNLF